MAGFLSMAHPAITLSGIAGNYPCQPWPATMHYRKLACACMFPVASCSVLSDLFFFLLAPSFVAKFSRHLLCFPLMLYVLCTFLVSAQIFLLEFLGMHAAQTLQLTVLLIDTIIAFLLLRSVLKTFCQFSTDHWHSSYTLVSLQNLTPSVPSRDHTCKASPINFSTKDR